MSDEAIQYQPTDEWMAKRFSEFESMSKDQLLEHSKGAMLSKDNAQKMGAFLFYKETHPDLSIDDMERQLPTGRWSMPSGTYGSFEPTREQRAKFMEESIAKGNTSVYLVQWSSGNEKKE